MAAKKPVYKHTAWNGKKWVTVYSFFEKIVWANAHFYYGALSEKDCRRFYKKGKGFIRKDRYFSESNSTDHFYSDDGSWETRLIYTPHKNG